MQNSTIMQHQLSLNMKQKNFMPMTPNSNNTNFTIKNCVSNDVNSSNINMSSINKNKLGTSNSKLLSHSYNHQPHSFHQQQQQQHNYNENLQENIVLNNSNNHNISNRNSMNSSNSCGGPLDSFPKAFITSMKTLFDILDDNQTGFVKLEDIEKGWQDDGSKGLPHGVIDSLRKVTPANGLLSFERFCAGLKICLLRNQAANTGRNKAEHNQVIMSPTITKSEHNKTRRLSSDNILNSTNKSNNVNANINDSYTSTKSSSTVTKKSLRPPSAPLLDIENPIPNNQWNSNTATVRPMPGQRTLSLPQLSPGDSDDMEILPPLDAVDPLIAIPPQPINQDVYSSAPPKPPRTGLLSTQNSNAISTSIPNSQTGILTLQSLPPKQINSAPIDKAEIRSALQNWQMGVLMNEMESKDKWNINYNNSNNHYLRGSADGGSIDIGNSDSISPRIVQSSIPSIEVLPNQLYSKKSTSKRREPRRHTLQNGVDYNLLKRLKQYEEERDLLYQGFTAVEKAREWYLQQIAVVQEKIKYLGRMGSHVEQWSEVHQERLDFQKARVHEINRHLATLADTWERGGFPMHMNLAFSNGYINRVPRGVLVRPVEKD